VNPAFNCYLSKNGGREPKRRWKGGPEPNRRGKGERERNEEGKAGQSPKEGEKAGRTEKKKVREGRDCRYIEGGKLPARFKEGWGILGEGWTEAMEEAITH
jgi:hypothetical protein